MYETHYTRTNEWPSSKWSMLGGNYNKIYHIVPVYPNKAVQWVKSGAGRNVILLPKSLVPVSHCLKA